MIGRSSRLRSEETFGEVSSIEEETDEIRYERWEYGAYKRKVVREVIGVNAHQNSLMKAIASQNPHKRAIQAKGATAENAIPRKNATRYNWTDAIKLSSENQRENDDAHSVLKPVEPFHEWEYRPKYRRDNAQQQEDDPRGFVAIKAIVHDSPNACRDQPADPNVVHPGAYNHPCVVSTPRHGVPHGASEETEESGGGKYEGREALG